MSLNVPIAENWVDQQQPSLVADDVNVYMYCTIYWYMPLKMCIENGVIVQNKGSVTELNTTASLASVCLSQS